MNEERISLETAMLAKEKGFDIPSRYGYNIYVTSDPEVVQKYELDEERNWNISIGASYTAPTQDVLAKWLREKFGIHIWIKWDYSSLSHREVYSIEGLIKEDDRILRLTIRGANWYRTYEEALEDALIEGLKRI